VAGLTGTITLHSSLFTLLLLLSCSSPKPPAASRQPPSAPGLPACTLIVSGHAALVEVASDNPARVQGLMFRQGLAPDSGMLFVFEDEQPRSFWMHNTYIPLSIAFIDSGGIITDVLEMAPLDTTVRYPSSRPARYAIEMNSGWFAARGITAGDTVRGLPR